MGCIASEQFRNKISYQSYNRTRQEQSPFFQRIRPLSSSTFSPPKPRSNQRDQRDQRDQRHRFSSTCQLAQLGDLTQPDFGGFNSSRPTLRGNDFLLSMIDSLVACSFALGISSIAPFSAISDSFSNHGYLDPDALLPTDPGRPTWKAKKQAYRAKRWSPSQAGQISRVYHSRRKNSSKSPHFLHLGNLTLQIYGGKEPPEARSLHRAHQSSSALCSPQFCTLSIKGFGTSRRSQCAFLLSLSQINCSPQLPRVL
jgi:hypothetical protein